MEQARVLRELLTQKDRVVLLQGFAGTGKTTLLQHVQAMTLEENALNPSRKEILFLAPTHTAVKELQTRGLTGQTLDRFLWEAQNGKLSLTEEVRSY